MKLVFIVVDAMFDSAFPLIKRLKDRCDLICVLGISKSENIISIDFGELKGCGINNASSFPVLDKFKEYLPLENTFLIRHNYPRTIVGFLKYMRNERIFVEKLKADYVFYFNEPVHALSFSLIYKGRWGMGIHDPIFHSSQDNKLFYQLIRKILFRKCDYFLFSESDRNRFIDSYGLDRSAVHILSLGPYEHLQQEVTSNVNNKREKSLELLFFGKISRYKGLRYLLEALKQMIQKGYDDIRLTIAGKGQIENDIIDLNDSEHLRIFNRYIPDKELATLISECDLVVCPYTDATQSGVIMSAFAFCKPVIATNVGGLVEMVVNDRHGLIVPARDPKALCNIITKIVNNKDLLSKWSERIKEDYYMGNKGWDKIADIFIDTIRIK